ncbi:MAG: endonuclease III [Candidatus Lindowbacteria bacterium RIFCSPLOWO2_12_FULL_62_27]|nr:MAG: endonuclease III [Candidatus Lindowbacteria bacterium RIFCSPLOWO2_02_FULL_62_12]OGH63242.1 MAG: endonuclease III [Candidatus Lindowbacteria bacterium RIFCSPLOWO2_12_FULL_62_27]
MKAGDSKNDTAARARKIIARLRKAYPDATCSLTHEDPLQLLVSTILSAQCTDERVNLVTPALFEKYRTARDFAGAPIPEIEKFVRSTGFYRNKARSIKLSCQSICDRFGGRVPDTMEELLSLHGVARKTANVVLGNAFGKNEGIVVDTHVFRIAHRLGLSAEKKNRDRMERDLMPMVPKKDWTDFSHLLIHHGRAVCKAPKPRCEGCPVETLCPRVGVMSGRGRAGG